MQIATKVLNETNMAQGIFPHDDLSRTTRMKHLIESRAALYALDAQMYYIWHAMMTNPEGCFTTTSGRTKTNAEAKEILNRMAESLGEKIDREFGLISKVMQADNMKTTE